MAAPRDPDTSADSDPDAGSESSEDPMSPGESIARDEPDIEPNEPG